MIREYLEIGGIVVEHPPSGEAIKVEPLFSSSENYLLNGTLVTQRSAVGGHRITLTSGPTHVVNAAVKEAVEQAWATGTPLHVVESLSSPGTQRVWAACLVQSAQFTEFLGSNRAFFTYTITFTGGK